MAKGIYTAIGGLTKKVKKAYAVVGGKTRKIKKIYTVVGGKTRLSWANSVFPAKVIVTGRNGTLLTSDDGETWEQINHNLGTSADLMCIAYGNGKFIAGNGTDIVESSNGGTTWSTTLSDAGSYFSACTFHNGTFHFAKIGKSSSTDGKIYSKASGATTWSSDTLSGSKDATFYDFRACNDVFLLGSDLGEYIHYKYINSTLDWNRMAIGVGEARTASYGAGKYLITGSHRMYYNLSFSINGANWTTLNITGGTSCVYAQDKFVLVSSNGLTRYSTDGVTWNNGNGLDSSKWYKRIEYIYDRFITVGTNGALAYSLDGINWTQVNTGITNELTGVAIAI